MKTNIHRLLQDEAFMSSIKDAGLNIVTNELVDTFQNTIKSLKKELGNVKQRYNSNAFIFNLVFIICMFVCCYALILEVRINDLKVENVRLETLIETNEIDPLYSFNRSKMKDLINTDFWSHNNFNGDTYHKRVNDSVLDGNIGEVLGRNHCSLEEIAKEWKESPSHQEIISDSSYTRAIITFTKETDGTCYWVGTYQRFPIGKVIGTK